MVLSCRLENHSTERLSNSYHQKVLESGFEPWSGASPLACNSHSADSAVLAKPHPSSVSSFIKWGSGAHLRALEGLNEVLCPKYLAHNCSSYCYSKE